MSKENVKKEVVVKEIEEVVVEEKKVPSISCIKDIIPVMKKWTESEDGCVEFIKAIMYMDVVDDVKHLTDEEVDIILDETANWVMDQNPIEVPIMNPDIVNYLCRVKYDLEQEKKLNQHEEVVKEVKEELKKEKEEKKDEDRQ